MDILKIAKISLNITTAAFSGTRLKGFSQNIAWRPNAFLFTSFIAQKFEKSRMALQGKEQC